MTNEHDIPTTKNDIETSVKTTGQSFQRFKVIHSGEREHFERIINEHLRAGWVLHGNPVFEVASDYYTQALMRWNDEGLTVDDFVGPSFK